MNIDYSTLFGGVSTSVQTAISDVLPIAVPVGGAILAVFLGWKLVKRFAK